jgi:hypothetical protein
MSATPPTEAIVNPTLVGESAGGAAEGARTRSGRRLVKTDVFKVSANRDAVPTRTRLPRAAAGDVVPDAIVPEVIGATEMEPVTPRRRRLGPSARKRKEARSTPQVLDRVDEAMGIEPAPAADEEEPLEEPATARGAHAQEVEDDDRTPTPEVSEDEAAADDSDDEHVEDVTPAARNARSGAKGPPPAQRELSSPDNSEDDEYYTFADLGRLNLDPVSVAHIFARQAERERRAGSRAGLDVAAEVWATTKRAPRRGSTGR